MISIFKEMRRYCNILLNAIKKFFQDIPMFWLMIAHYNFWWTLLGDSYLFPNCIRKRIKINTSKTVYKFLNSKYSSFINEYKEKKNNNWKFSKTIRCLWWQWIDNAPDLVKICINSIRKHSCWYEVIILDQYNYKNYIHIPKYILKKVEEKKTTITHLSDIIRMWLLKNYGWIWIDATMYITRDILYDFDKLNVISDNPKKYTLKYWGYEKWCSFFIGWKSNNILFDFVYNFFLQYDKDFDGLINYYLPDYSIDLAYKNISECKKDIDRITLSNNELFTLMEIFNNTYDEKKYKQLMEFWYFKLTNKAIFKEYDNKWNITNYGHFLRDNKL